MNRCSWQDVPTISERRDGAFSGAALAHLAKDAPDVAANIRDSAKRRGGRLGCALLLALALLRLLPELLADLLKAGAVLQVAHGVSHGVLGGGGAAGLSRARWRC